MKALIFILFFPVIASAQVTLVAHENILWLKNTQTGDSARVVTTTNISGSTRLQDSLQWNRIWATSNFAATNHTHTGVYQPAGNYLVAADIAGKQNTITTGTPAQYFKGDLSLGTYSGYSINVQALTSSPTDAQTVYFGMLPKAPVTAAATSKVYVRNAGTITAAEIYCYSGTAGTNESWSLYIRVNNTTDYLIATVSAAASERVFTNNSLSISLNANDYFEIKGVQPTWVTNPLTTIYGGYVKIN